MANQRLELTWIGKGEDPAIEPRILLHDPSKDYGDPSAENMLIHGDNLLALKALEQQYAGQVKCIYIDPPYNTGSAFDHYDDNLEHSTWLQLMKSRLEILKNLLSSKGSIFVQIDDEEYAYLKVLMDEVFGRSNYINTISVLMKNIAGASGGGETLSLVLGKRPELFTSALFISSQWDGDLNVLANAQTPLYIVIGENDSYYGSTRAINAYNSLQDIYENQGLSDEQINEILVLDVKEHEYFSSQGVSDEHAGLGLFAYDEDVMSWVFNKRK